MTFPTTQQSFTLATDRPGDGPALPARSRDGLPISISFSVNFRLRQTLLDLSRLYLQYVSCACVWHTCTQLALCTKMSRAPLSLATTWMQVR